MKSEREIYYEKLCNQYFDKFNQRYTINIGDMRTEEEHIEMLETALKTGVPIIIPQLEFKDGIVY